MTKEKIDKRNVADMAALTPVQEGILFHYLKNPDSEIYFEQLSLFIEGIIDIKIFVKAWEFVIAANEMLRSVFRWENVENPVQIILKESDFEFRYNDLLKIEKEKRKVFLETIKERDRHEGFDLIEVPFRVTLCKLEKDRYEMIISSHHILYDGWSNGIILKELFSAYADLLENRSLKKPKKKRFFEYVKWLRDQNVAEQEEYWQGYLCGFETRTILPLNTIEKGEDLISSTYEVEIEYDLQEKLEKFLRRNRLMFSTIFYCAYGILLQKYNNCSDVIFGTTVSGRSEKIKGMENIVGLFINTLPLRVQSNSKKKIKNLLIEIDEALQKREEYETTPLVDIKKYSRVDSGTELFDSIVVIENYPLDIDAIRVQGQLNIDSYSMFEMTNYDLTVTVSLSGRVVIKFIYDDKLFRREVIGRLSHHLSNILKDICEHPAKKLYEINILSGVEREQILKEFNRTVVDYPVAKTIYEIFKEQVRKSPGHIAIIAPRAKNSEQDELDYLEITSKRSVHPDWVSLTYREISEKVNNLALLLIKNGLNPGDIAAVMVKRSIGMVIGILSILKTGSIYLPIDPGYPADRKDYILRDSSAKVLLTSRRLKQEVEKFSSLQVEKIFIEDCRGEPCVSPSGKTRVGARRAVPSEPAAGSLKPVTNPENLAYIIYTSGSTGNPKGVMVSHRSAVNILFALQKEYPLKESDTYLLKTSYVFDVSVAELFGWFFGAGRLAILEQDGEKIPEKIITAIHNAAVTHINFVPSMFNVFVDELNSQNISKISSLRYIFAAGEELLPALVNKFANFNTKIVLENIYGPTEGTVYSSKFSLSEWQGKGSIPIGKPMQNMKLFILDKDKNCQPIGAPGELCIAGAGLARGYLNNPELTAEKFVVFASGGQGGAFRENCPPAPPAKAFVNKEQRTGEMQNLASLFLESGVGARRAVPKGLLYKTGDLARWLPDGDIEYLGRMDFQVKIRGFRVELGEIENRLLSRKDIKEAVVTARHGKAGDKYLCAYIVGAGRAVPADQGAVPAEEDSSEIPDSTKIREYLSQTLPDYMIPSYFVNIEKLPLTPTGKVDRKMLPEPEIRTGREYAVPRNEKEEKLVKIWAEVLDNLAGVIGIDDNFFEIGGHSLRATRLITKIHREFDVLVKLADFFKVPTIRWLSTYIEESSEEDRFKAIPAVEEKEYYPLSPTQKRFFLFQQLVPGDTSYNMNEVMIMEGLFEKERFVQTFTKLIRRHESLRTSFEMIEVEPVQKVHDARGIEFEIEYKEVQASSRKQQVEEPAANLEIHGFARQFVRPFDLSCAPLLRIGLIKQVEKKYFLMVDMHHIISDGTSTGIFIGDFLSLYNGEDLNPLRIRYKDYVCWLNIKRNDSRFKEETNKEMEGKDVEEELLELPTDYMRPAVKSFAGDKITFEIGKEESHILNSIAIKEDTTLFMVLFAIFNIFLSKLSRQENIVAGSPIAGRLHDDLEGVIGLFINTLAIRNRTSAGKKFTQFLKEVKENSLQAFESQEYQYEALAEQIDVARNTGRNPLFDVMFVLQNMELPEVEIPGLKIKRRIQEDRTSKFDMTLYCEEVGAILLFTFEFCIKLFKQETIKRFTGYFKKIVSVVLQDPGKEIGEIEFITAEEKREILFGFNDTKSDYPRNKTIHELFEEQVEKKPGKTALIYEDNQVTFSELNRGSNRLAEILRSQGVEPCTVVGILFRRSLEMLTGILGILKSGGAYMPINPGYPPERTGFILRDSGTKFLVANTDVKKFDFAGKIFDLRDELFCPRTGNIYNPVMVNTPADLAYIIYTSGSTGAPKGTLIDHGSVVNILKNLEELYPLCESGAYLLKTNYMFDVSVTEIFCWVFGKGKLVILEPGMEGDPGAIAAAVKRNKVTHINFVPSMLKVFLDSRGKSAQEDLKNLQYVIVAGEAFPPTLAKRAVSLDCPTKFENIYGPTEATIYSTGYSLIPDEKIDNVPIGKPLNNLRNYIVDKSLHLQPLNISGELCIAGVGLARGYLNRPELTDEKFVDDPFIKGERIYHTGDLTRWQADGNVGFLGRMDYQVKIRGFRIETGEVESLLLKYEGVKDAVVIARDEKDGEKYLCAYIVGAKGPVPSDKELFEFLSLNLPDYMIPSYFVFLDEIPLNPNGKVDRKSLPVPDSTASVSEYKPPRNQLEEKLVRIWSEVLHVDYNLVGIDTNFFEVGGHSLRATLLISKIHKELDVKLQLAEVFKMSTIRGLASYMESAAAEKFITIQAVEKKDYYPLSPAQKRFFIFQQMEVDSISYNVYESVETAGPLDRKKFLENVKKLIRRHESFRTSFALMDGEPVQRIHSLDKIQFGIEYYEIGKNREEVDRRGKQETISLGEFYLDPKIIAGARPAVPGELKSDNRDLIHQRQSAFIRPFDLSCAPLLRVLLLKINEEKHFLMIDMHHIITDGTSTAIFIRDFLSFYNGEELSPLRLHYRGYVQWLNNKKKKERDRESGPEDFAEELLELPTDYLRPAERSYEGTSIDFEITGEQTAALKKFSLKEDSTLFMVLFAIFNIFLAKLSSQEKIVVGSPIAGRQHNDLEGIIGLFINTLAIKSYPLPGKRFTWFLKEVKEYSLQTFENQEYQYEWLIEKIDTARTTGRNPLFDVMFVLQNMELPEIEIPGLKIKPMPQEILGSKFDMTLYCEELGENLRFTFEFCLKLFKPETIKRFIGYFKKIVAAVLQNPEKEIGEIEFITDDEKQEILYDFNDTEVEYPRDKTIYRLFEEQVARTPDNIAVIGGSSNLTYRQLNERANRLARVLRRRGIKANRVVGIMLKRSGLLVEVIYAVLKAGGAYLPIDPEYPEKRIISMLENSRSVMLLTKKEILKQKKLPEVHIEVIKIDELSAVIAGQSRKNLQPLSRGEDLIYIIFTSGSTGVPKGAGVYQRSFVNLVNWFVKDFNFNTDDSNLLMTSFSFDLTQKNFYASLILGGVLCIPAGNYFDPAEVLREIEEKRVTWINCTPSMFFQLIEFCNQDELKKMASLRYVYLGGEPVSIGMFLKWLDSEYCRGEIVNTYGPTECTDISNSYRIKDPHRFLTEAVPIGGPIYNVKLYVADKNLQLLPVGIAGELLIGGESVGIGYVNDEKLTGKKFVRHSFVKGADEQLLYRTGDLVKWLPDGNIVFIGRMDYQVKIRGFRIEIGEIENRLLDHEGIKEAVVIDRDDESGGKYLCAYFVPSSCPSPGSAQLREYLSQNLPDYMIPSCFVDLEEMPLNPNGKVNRKALPVPEIISDREYAAPRNELEDSLVNIWSEVLGIEKGRIGIDDNFFELGGHSLKAAELIARIHQKLNTEITIKDIFKVTRIRGLSEFIGRGAKRSYMSIESVEEKEYYALSSAQKRLYLLQQMDLESTGYNVPSLFVVEGKLEKKKLCQNFRKLIRRHESLRTSFHMVKDEPVQVLHKPGDIEFNIEYIKAEPATCNSQPATSTIKRFIRPFNLSKAPLLRVGLSQMDKDKHILQVDMPHIISDGISSNLFVQDFMSLYSEARLPVLRIRYKDFSEWQNDRKENEALKRQEEYWLEEFAGEIPVINLPADFPRPAIRSFAGSTRVFKIGTEVVEKLKALALETKTTLFMVLLSIFNVFLAKLCIQEDIIVGSPVSGRTHGDLEQVIGIFINTLALRNYPLAGKSFNEFLIELAGRTLTAFDNQEYQFEDLVEKVEVARDASRNPLFDVLFVLQNMETSGIKIPGLKLTPYEQHGETAKFDLTFNGIEGVEGLQFTVSYSTEIFKDETVQRFIEYFKTIIFSVLKAPGQKLYEIEMLSEEERTRLLIDFNDTRANYSQDKTINRLFAEQVERTMDKIAVIGMGRNVQSRQSVHLTYRQLNERANRLARLLRDRGILPDTISGILTEPSLEMIIGILAVIKAGGAYLPLEPRHPAERMAYMLADSRAKLLLTQAHLKDRIRFSGDFINIDDKNLYKGDGGNLAEVNGSGSVIYAIYTSGTTGKSKGALIRNSNLVNYVEWFAEKANLSADDRTALTSSFGFDLGYTAIFSSLLTGCQLHVLVEEIYLSPEDLINYIHENRISYLKMTPSLFSTIVDSSIFSKEKCTALRLLVLGGEEIKLKDVKKAHEILNRLEVMNHYGPTEATIGCIAQLIDFFRFEDYIKKPTIGFPIHNTRVFVLDRNLALLPGGVVGDLYVSGEGLVRGYLNRVELTTERFVESKYLPKDKLYRTGDLACRMPDGAIEFVGRSDNQVKIRGFRIETGEIESHLLGHGDVKETVVLVRENEQGDKFLCAYVVPTGEGGFREESSISSELKKYLSQTLPGYMIPSYFVELDRIPLTPNGKVDRRKLPALDTEISGEEYVPPADRLETMVCHLWSEVLGIEKIGVEDNFFLLGGHSLTAIMITSRIQEALGVKVGLSEIFRTPTIRGIAAYIRNQKGAAYYRAIPIAVVEEKEYYALSSAQKRLYILQQMDEESISYNTPRMQFLEGNLDRNRLENTFKKLIERHESFRTSFPIVADEPMQKIHRPDDIEFEIEYHDAQGRARSAAQKELDTECEEGNCAPWAVRFAGTIERFFRPFDLYKPPLLRVGLIRINALKHLLLVDMHHIITDGISTGIFIKEFMAVYSGEELVPLWVRYKDYSEWQSENKESESIKKQQKYWLDQFKGDLPVLNLPTDYIDSTEMNFTGDSMVFEIAKGDTEALKELAKEEGASLFMVLLAIYNILLSKLSCSEDVIIGMPIMGRRQPELQNTIGMFVNTLVLRNHPEGEKTFREFLKEVKERTLAAVENQDYQFEDLVEQVDAKIDRDPLRNPLFDVMFILQTIDIPDVEIPGLKLTPYEYKSKTSKFDLTLVAEEKGEILLFTFEFSTQLFKKETIERFTGYFKDLVNVVLEDRDIKISGINISPGLADSEAEIYREAAGEFGF